MECFLPLVHLYLAFQAITILGNDSKLCIAQVLSILGHACDVHQIVIVIFIRATLINRYTGFARSNDQLIESNSFLFVFPKQDLGERNEEQAEHHECNSMWVVSLVNWFVR